MLNETSGGLDPREVIDVAVNPIGSPLSVAEVIIATPEACIRNTDFSASDPVRGNLGSFVVISR